MTTKDKIVDALITLVIWLIISLAFEFSLTSNRITKSDFMYWGGAYIGYVVAIATNRVVKRPYEEQKIISNVILDDIKIPDKKKCICERNAEGENLIGFCPIHHTDFI